MKVLAVFLLAALACSLAEATVGKCDLRDQLMRGIADLRNKPGMPMVLQQVNTVARLVCHAEKSTGFSTGATKELPGGVEDTDHSGINPNQQQSDGQTQAPPQMWTLYGIFQLSNRIFCSDGQVPSENICELTCNKLTDGDTTDDVDCLLKFFSNALDNSTPQIEDLFKMTHLLFGQDCVNADDIEYFTGCPPPPVI